MSGSKLLDGITLYVQIVLMFGSKLLDGNTLYVQLVYYQTLSNVKLNIQGDSIQKF
jgi:hypothetical protein